MTGPATEATPPPFLDPRGTASAPSTPGEGHSPRHAPPQAGQGPSGGGQAYAALGLLALIWGFSFVLIKYGLAAMPPLVLVFMRVLFAAATLGTILAVRRRNPVPTLGQRWLGVLLAAIFGSAVPFFLITWGELYIASGLAAILNSTTPLWTAILAIWATPNERPRPLTYAGVVVGLGGTAILFSPSFGHGGLTGSLAGGLAVVGASLSYAVAALAQRRLLSRIDATEASFWQMAVAALLLSVIAIPQLGHVRPVLPNLAAVAALGAIGSGVANILYFFILNRLGGTRGASVTLLVPMTAVVWGVVLFGERVSVVTAVGMAVILAGVTVAVAGNVLRPGGRRASAAASHLPGGTDPAGGKITL